MALIEKSKGRRESQSPSGYTRLFGIEKLGNLISRVHSTVISSGSELENLIWQYCKQIDSLDDFISNTNPIIKPGIWIARKRQIKKSNIIRSVYEPDFLAFDLINRTCYIIEVKDGDTFDTKKAAGEHNALVNFKNDISAAIPFLSRIYICSFNSSTKEEIYNGLKKRFSIDEVMTGREMCVLFGIDYDEIINIRMSDQKNNVEYFLNSLLVIEEVSDLIIKKLKSKISH